MTIRTTVRFTAVAALFTVTACAPSNQARPLNDTSPADLLTEADLASVQDYTVLEAIERLRPRWLRARGPSIGVDMTNGGMSAQPGETVVKVYLDEIPHSLRRLDVLEVRDVLRIRFLPATQATLRFGVDHEGGAILVTTKTE